MLAGRVKGHGCQQHAARSTAKQSIDAGRPLRLAVEQRALSRPRGPGQRRHGTRICQPGMRAPRLLLVSHAVQWLPAAPGAVTNRGSG